MPVGGMKRSAEAAWERAMKAQEVILRAIAKQITWWQAAEITGSILVRDASNRTNELTTVEF